MVVTSVGEGRLGRFELRGPLGWGGVGDVRLAYDPDRKSMVALKLIRAGVDQEMVEAEKRGVLLQQKLHPRVPQVAAVFELNEIEDDPFYVAYVAMEYVEGVDLSAELKRGRLAPGRAVSIAIQLCSILESIELASKALGYGDSRVIHSDIKPENIRLQEGDRVRLLDFGVAKNLALSRKFTRNVFGSTFYLAPERISNEVVDSQTDLWAVSVVLFEMLAGHVPFRGDTTGAVERRICSGQPPDPLQADCPKALRSILFKCFQTDPGLRFPNAATLRVHLEAFRDGRPLAISEPTQRISQVRQQTAPPPICHERPKLSRSERRRLRARRWRALLKVSLLILVAAAVACHGHALSEGKAIEKALAEPGADLSALYDRYREAEWSDPLGFFLSHTAKALKGGLVAQADRTLSRFRSDASTVREDWESSLRWLQTAAELANPEEELQGRIAFCEGQLARVDAEESLGSSLAEAKEKWRDALQSFEKARMIAPELVEVYLALASIYNDPKTGLADPKKLREALEEMERRGGGQDERSKVALVEIRVSEATQILERSTRARGQERIDLLYEAGDGFEKALSLCESLSRNRMPQACRKAQERKAEISRKLTEQNQV